MSVLLQSDMLDYTGNTISFMGDWVHSSDCYSAVAGKLVYRYKDEDPRQAVFKVVIYLPNLIMASAFANVCFSRFFLQMDRLIPF